MENRTVVHECEAKWGRKAYIELRDNAVVFDDSMGEYGPIEFDVQVLVDALNEHRKKLQHGKDDGKGHLRGHTP